VSRRVAVAMLALVLGLARPADAGVGDLADAQRLAEYDVKADVVERLTRFVAWPPLRLGEGEAPFVACVWGEDPMGPRLDAMVGSRSFKGHPLEVRRAPVDELAHCHLLWIAAADLPSVASIVSRTRGRPVLTVGDTPGFAELGVIVTLRMEAGRVRFQIDRAAAEAAGLSVSAQLLRLADPVGARR
jgi:hypothetical protein